MKFDADSLGQVLPAYLTGKGRDDILQALSDFPRFKNYYFTHSDPDALQGDGWTGFKVFDFDSEETQRVRGIVISNSCDIASTNTRIISPNVTFAPLILLNAYEAVLASSGLDGLRLENHINDVRGQRITSLFYLPATSSMPESVAVLDQLHSMPANLLEENERCERFFSLSSAGFYIFLFKLSVHFCRFHDNVDRSA